MRLRLFAEGDSELDASVSLAFIAFALGRVGWMKQVFSTGF